MLLKYTVNKESTNLLNQVGIILLEYEGGVIEIRGHIADIDVAGSSLVFKVDK